jgi:4a-hydroxytetrahydrobiopterin dehydratase
MRPRVFIVVLLYALAASFTAVAYSLYLPQTTLITDRGWGTAQRGAGGPVLVVEVYADSPAADGLRVGDEVAPLLAQLGGWQVVGEHPLSKEYKFQNFADALAFVNRVGAVAEGEGHHPDVSFGWGYARLEIYTHAIDGLSESDFVLAARIDAA